IKLDRARHKGGGAYARGRHIRRQSRAHNRLKRQTLCLACDERLPRLRLGQSAIGWVDQKGHNTRSWKKFMQHATTHVRFTPKADICSALAHVRFGPIADIPPPKAELIRAATTEYEMHLPRIRNSNIEINPPIGHVYG